MLGSIVKHVIGILVEKLVVFVNEILHDSAIVITKTRWRWLSGLLVDIVTKYQLDEKAAKHEEGAEAVEDELSGLIIDDPTDEHQLAEMVTSLLRDPSKRRSMASYGRKRSESLFSYDVLAEQLEIALSWET